MEIINVSYPNDGLGDKLRDSMIKVNNNFVELSDLINSMDLSISGIAGLDDAINTIGTSITGLQSQINSIGNLPELVIPSFIDSYRGTRLTPTSSTHSGFHISGNTNTNIGFSVVNTNTGNGAISTISVSGTTSTGFGMGFQYNSPNYFVPYLRDNTALYSFQDMFIFTSKGKSIDFRTGTNFGDETSKLKINNNGQLNIGVTPLTDNSVVKGLARKTNGDLVEFDRTCFFTQLFSHGSVSPLDNTIYYIGNFPDLSPNTSNAITRRIHSQGKGYVSSVSIGINIGGTIGSSENSTFELHNLTQGTFVKITTTAVHNTDSLILYTLSPYLNVKEDDELQIRWITPAWVTNPTTVRQRFTIKINVI